MRRIDSNIGAVMGRFKTFREGIPAAVQNAMRPALWMEDAVRVATLAVNGVAEESQRQYVPDFVRAVVMTMTSNGMDWVLDPNSARLNMQKFVAQNALMGELPLLAGLLGNDREKINDLILQWVREEKIKTEVDAGKSDEQIAENLQNILFDSDRTYERVMATAKLVPHLQRFYDGKMGASGVNPEVVSLWLKVILSAWRELVRSRLPKMVRENIRQAWREAKQ